MATRTYSVEGMSCAHCVNTITGEVGKLPGVGEVAVDLDAKTVTVTGEPVDDGQIRAAIDEAGYTVVG